MEIFLSYSSKDRTKAEEIALTLQAQGHGVFFDKDDLSGGEDFHAVIREHIANADRFIFLISPESVPRTGLNSGDTLRVTVTYTYGYAVLSRLIPGLGPLNLVATTVVRME